MLIKGGVSPRTTSRVDAPQQVSCRPCRAQPSEDFLTFEDDVVFEWSKTVPPDFDERRRSRSRAEERSRTADSHLPGLFSEVIGESLSQRSASASLMPSPIASLIMSPSSNVRDGNVGDSAAWSTRSGSANVNVGTRPASPYRCQTAPPAAGIAAGEDIDLDATSMVDVVTEHELRTRERSKSSRLYGENSRSLKENVHPPRSARKARRPNEERYLQHKYRERPCSRAESFVNEDLFDSTTDLSRECCDVLGPRHCYDCTRITQRNDSLYRNKSAFPSIHMTPKNISTITLVQRLFPELTTLDILEGVGDGYISSRSFSKDRLMEIVERKKAEARRKDIQDKWKGAAKRKISAFSVPDKVHFFSNFTDLRAQILAQRGSYTGFKGTLFPMDGLQQLPPPAEVELIIRKEEDRENPANYFCPPIMTREEILRQKSQPRFYAGSTQEYKLPDAPPLTEILHKTNKALRDMDSQSVVPKPSKGPKPGSPRVDGTHGSGVGGPAPMSPLALGGSCGIFRKTQGQTRPSKLGRPEMGAGGFARKSLAKSSFSRPLQMETLTEDGSQSERSEVEEEDEEEEVKGEKISPVLHEEDEEDDGELGDNNAAYGEELLERDEKMEEENKEEHQLANRKKRGVSPGQDIRRRIAQVASFHEVLEEGDDMEEEEEEQEEEENDQIEYQEASDSDSDFD